MKTMPKPNSRLLMAALITAITVAILPWRIVAQDNPDDAAKRLKQLEKENAELRAELDKLRQTPEKPNDATQARVVESGRVAAQLAVEINAAEVELAALRTHYTDQHPKVREAETRLKKMKELQANEKSRTVATKERASRERDLYLEEMELARKHVDSIQELMRNGRANPEDLFRAQRELFALQREVANLEKNQSQMKALVQEEIEIVQRQLSETKKLVEQRLAPVGHDLSLRRELLKLKRELLSLD